MILMNTISLIPKMSTESVFRLKTGLKMNPVEFSHQYFIIQRQQALGLYPSQVIAKPACGCYKS
jgi:hypothetical protein